MISAGGKRLRPSLAIAAAAGGGASITDDVLMGGVSVELVHLASLYHDDVMDEATSRRGVPSVNARWGNLVAVVSGDFLLAKAAGIAASLGTEIAGLMADTLARLCEGQLCEVRSVFDTDRSIDTYLVAVRGKTASLMATSCRVGAIAAGLDRELIDAVTLFGEGFGMAFQIYDDILDIIGDEEKIGKLTGQDLAEGVYTLPTLRALEDPEVGPKLKQMLSSPLSDTDRVLARSMVASTDAVSYCKEAALSYVRRANSSLAVLPDKDVAESLGSLGIALLDALSIPRESLKLAASETFLLFDKAEELLAQ